MIRIVSMVVRPSCAVLALALIGPVGARTPAWQGHQGSAAGQRVFMRNCARCHGAGGQGKKGPSLTRTALDPGEIEQTVSWGRRPKMPAFGKRLSSSEIKAVVAYVRSLGGTALASVAPVGARTPALHARSGKSAHHGSASGRQVFLSNCARCHGASGQGKNGPKLAGNSLGLDAIEEKVTAGSSKMPSFKKQLSPAQIKVVAAYVQSLGGRS